MAPYYAVLPDWVILGVQYPDEVQIYASNRLTLADLRNMTMLGDDTQIEMCVTALQLIVVAGKTYQEALRTLFEQWTPEPAQRPGINPHRDALPPIPPKGLHRG